MKQLLFFLVFVCATQKNCHDEDKRIECEGLRLHEKSFSNFSFHFS